ncbi:MAG: helix-turn-helix transcriptional regulator [Nostocaceae cyanobacterium]|nr:helix-turn-helix transcriptional regulator [Nostocaceae cyanobacterium]
MGKVGKALQQVLKTYGITQNRLAVAMDTRRSNVGRWFHGQIDPTGDTIADIAQALETINPTAAEEFVRLYLGEFLHDRGQKTDAATDAAADG